MSELLFNELPRPTFRWLRVNHTCKLSSWRRYIRTIHRCGSESKYTFTITCGAALLDAKYERC